jgi:hypothetical protein
MKSMRMVFSRHAEQFEAKRTTSRISMGKPEVESPRRKLRRMWEVNIKTDLRKIGWGME